MNYKQMVIRDTIIDCIKSDRLMDINRLQSIENDELIDYTRTGDRDEVINTYNQAITVLMARSLEVEGDDDCSVDDIGDCSCWAEDIAELYTR